jgi:hypothetical protein
MSFSFSVPATPSADFAAAAQTAKDNYEKASESNDYMLTQLASGLADAAIKAAAELVSDLADGNVVATLSGHYATDGKSASSVAVGITVTPVAPAPTV